jgi:alpha-methylacyl-CoA racemase
VSQAEFGALSGLRVLEFAGLGPVPYCGMLLADMGADVVRVDRPGGNPIFQRGFARFEPRHDFVGRGRTIVELDLKSAEGVAVARQLARAADVLLEGFRPGVMENLTLGPESLMKANFGLVYARMTGWGRTGPEALRASHDINILALSGVLHCCARRGELPVPPLNLVADYGGGALLAVGILSALVERGRSGRGQVVDASMLASTTSLMAFIHGLVAAGNWNREPGTNYLDTAAPFYDVYETRDGRFIAVGAVENEFWARVVERLALGTELVAAQDDVDAWPSMKEEVRAAFRTRSFDEWVDLFADVDACVTPVLRPDEALEDPQCLAEAFVEYEGVAQPAPASRLSRTPGDIRRSSTVAVSDILAGWTSGR